MVLSRALEQMLLSLHPLTLHASQVLLDLDTHHSLVCVGQDLHADEIDLGLTGFDADELGKLLGLDEAEGDEEADEGLTVGPVEYRVVVITQGESDQSQLITELEQRGYKCQPLMS